MPLRIISLNNYVALRFCAVNDPTWNSGAYVLQNFGMSAFGRSGNAGSSSSADRKASNRRAKRP